MNNLPPKKPFKITKEDVDRKFLNAFRVLVVEPNIVCLSVLLQMLKAFFFQVTVVRSANEALSILKTRRNEFDIVLSHVGEPEVAFLLLNQVVQQIQLPIVMISAATKKTRQKCLNAGAQYFLEKPVKMEDLSSIWKFAEANHVQNVSGTIQSFDNEKLNHNGGIDPSMKKPFRYPSLPTRQSFDPGYFLPRVREESSSINSFCFPNFSDNVYTSPSYNNPFSIPNLNLMYPADSYLFGSGSNLSTFAANGYGVQNHIFKSVPIQFAPSYDTFRVLNQPGPPKKFSQNIMLDDQGFISVGMNTNSGTDAFVNTPNVGQPFNPTHIDNPFGFKCDEQNYLNTIDLDLYNPLDYTSYRRYESERNGELGDALLGFDGLWDNFPSIL